MMTPKEYAELLEYINDKHSWRNMYENYKQDRKIVKYVRCSCDTRDGKIWIVEITFQSVSNSKLKDDKREMIFREEKCTLEYIKAWLNNFEKEGDKDGSKV